jgi:UDP-3-O-[3-hydroxymyristoyl] glucosamine N-acyltransferase
MRLGTLAARLDCVLEGDADYEITSVASLDHAGPTDLSFIADARYLRAAAASRAGALLAPPDLALHDPAAPPNRLRTLRPDLVLALALELLRPPWRPQPGIDPTASIHPTAELGPGCHVGAFVAIGEGCRLGAGAVLHPHVVLYPHVVAGQRLLAHAHAVIREGTHLGDDVVLQPGVVLGGDGFGFVRRADGSHAKIPQVGAVVVGDAVEIQANSCVDRATLETTRIGPGVKIDNLAQVAHNCDVGAHTLICAQVGLAGSTTVGARAVLAGQVGVAGHCRIGDDVVITAQSGTHGDLAAGGMYSGSPAFEHAQWLRATAVFARLGDLQREVRRLRALLGPQTPKDA